MSNEFRDRLKAAFIGAALTAILSSVGYGYAQFSGVQTTLVAHEEKIRALEQRQIEIWTDVREIRKVIERR